MKFLELMIFEKFLLSFFVNVMFYLFIKREGVILLFFL